MNAPDPTIPCSCPVVNTGVNHHCPRHGDAPDAVDLREVFRRLDALPARSPRRDAPDPTRTFVVTT